MIKKALENDIRFTIYTIEMAKRVSSIAVGMNRTANIHLKFNTGLNRIGVDLSSAIEFTRSVKNLPHILIEGVFTHYSCADQIGNDKTEKQLSAFLATIKNLKQQGMEFPIYHSANTPAALMIPEAHLDMVRIGMGIPGLYPSEEFRTLINLEFALTWKTKVSYVRMVKSGEFVGYGCKYKCVSDTTIVTIPIGDADGMSKRFETKGNVLIRGKRYKVVAVSMDQAMVDLQGIVSDLQIGEEVVIFGTQQGNKIDPHVTAREIGADVEEILCQISTRVPRLYVQ